MSKLKLQILAFLCDVGPHQAGQVSVLACSSWAMPPSFTLWTRSSSATKALLCFCSSLTCCDASYTTGFLIHMNPTYIHPTVISLNVHNRLPGRSGLLQCCLRDHASHLVEWPGCNFSATCGQSMPLCVGRRRGRESYVSRLLSWPGKTHQD